MTPPPSKLTEHLLRPRRDERPSLSSTSNKTKTDIVRLRANQKTADQVPYLTSDQGPKNMRLRQAEQMSGVKNIAFASFEFRIAPFVHIHRPIPQRGGFECHTVAGSPRGHGDAGCGGFDKTNVRSRSFLVTRMYISDGRGSIRMMRKFHNLRVGEGKPLRDVSIWLDTIRGSCKRNCRSVPHKDMEKKKVRDTSKAAAPSH